MYADGVCALEEKLVLKRERKKINFLSLSHTHSQRRRPRSEGKLVFTQGGEMLLWAGPKPVWTEPAF